MPTADELEACATCGAKYYRHELKGRRVFTMCPKCKRETCPNCRTKEPQHWVKDYHTSCLPADYQRKPKGSES